MQVFACKYICKHSLAQIFLPFPYSIDILPATVLMGTNGQFLYQKRTMIESAIHYVPDF